MTLTRTLARIVNSARPASAPMPIAKDTAPKAGIYFLLRGARVFYIGESANIGRLLRAKLERFSCDRWAWVPCDEQRRFPLLRRYVLEMRPPGNLKRGQLVYRGRYLNPRKIPAPRTPRARPVSVDGKIYPSLMAAGTAHGLTREGARYRATKKIDGWKFASKREIKTLSEA